MTLAPNLAPGITVFERGWLSSNNILISGADSCALIDSGYLTHAEQTLSLLKSALADRPLSLLLNTHLHSDHCGGNAALQDQFAQLTTLIPPGQAELVRDWDPGALSYEPTGQICRRFRYDAVLQPGTEIRLGDQMWQVHAAPGHDPHSVILFEPASRVLVSADALWERGFGVVFPELDGLDAFDAVGRTLDLIEALEPRTVIPGHGAVFFDVTSAIDYARQRLESLVENPVKHLRHACKVLLKFKLLELQCLERDAFRAWALGTPYLQQIHQRHFSDCDLGAWLDQLTQDLIISGAASCDGSLIRNR